MSVILILKLHLSRKRGETSPSGL